MGKNKAGCFLLWNKRFRINKTGMGANPCLKCGMRQDLFPSSEGTAYHRHGCKPVPGMRRRRQRRQKKSRPIKLIGRLQ